MISDLPKFLGSLQNCPNLLSLNMIGNYVSKINHKKYIIEVLTNCSKLVKVDEIIINPHVREAFKVIFVLCRSWRRKTKWKFKWNRQRTSIGRGWKNSLKSKNSYLTNSKPKNKKFKKPSNSSLGKKRNNLMHLNPMPRIIWARR